MRSIEEAHFVNDARAIPSELPLWASENPLRLRQAEAAQRHRDLDDAISMLSDVIPSDELLIARLKKRKLQIKDEIARIARMFPS
jgi:hypothetical protein